MEIYFPMATPKKPLSTVAIVLIVLAALFGIPVFIAVAWGAYEIIRPRTADEEQVIRESEKLRKEIERDINRKKG